MGAPTVSLDDMQLGIAGELASLGLLRPGTVHHNLTVPRLIELSIQRGEGVLAENGALFVRTGKYTGRSPQDRYIVDSPGVHAAIDWGAVNIPMRSEVFWALRRKQAEHLAGRELFVTDAFLGADLAYRLPVRIISELAWHGLFARQLFLRPAKELDAIHPEFTVIATPGLNLRSDSDGTRTEAAVAIDFEDGLILDIATAYAGEIKKSLFSVLNFILPSRGVFPMHCSANLGSDGGTAIFFGLSGTGKADPARRMIGDDEHGWSDTGIFNFEGGLYAKCIGLRQESEPQIWNSLRFGAVVENVPLDPMTRRPDFDDESITENTRAGFPVEFIPGAVMPGIGGHPRTVIFLTADAFGVMPPIARLTREGAIYHFLSGFTSKLAGTERGIIEPQATFSACFGAPFMPRPPMVYAKLLADKLDRHGARVFLIDTGWLWGPYGVGRRIPIKYTRQMVTAAIENGLEGVEYRHDPLLNLDIPLDCCGTPRDILVPRDTWKDKEAYDAAALRLARMFSENFKRFRDVPKNVVAAGPLPDRPSGP